MKFSVLASEILGVDAAAISPETLLLGIKGWDSLKLLKLIVTVEKRFSVRFDAADVTRVATWGDLTSLAAKMKVPL